jgi:hypothetical protein
MLSASPEDNKVLLNKLITESKNVRAIFLSSNSPGADVSFNTHGKLSLTEGRLELLPEGAEDFTHVLSLKEATLLECPCKFTSPLDFAGLPSTAFIDRSDSFILSLTFDLPGGASLTLIGLG